MLLAATSAFSCPTNLIVNQSAGPYTSISSAVLSIPASLSGDVCVDVQDGAVYLESVTIQGLTTNGHRVYIGALQGETPPTLTPPAGSSAAFLLMNSGVSLANILIQPGSALAFGVDASSSDITISSVSVLDPAGWIFSSGIGLGSASSLANSTVAVVGANGVYLNGSSGSATFPTASRTSTIPRAP